MASRPSIVSEALAAVSSGIDDYLELVGHLLERTDLDAQALEAGEPPDEYLFYLLEDDHRILVTDEDEVIRLDERAEGLVFTHRVRSEEVAGDMVDLVPDLSLLDLGSEELWTPPGRCVSNSAGAMVPLSRQTARGWGRVAGSPGSRLET
jgi:hypothetical protein